MLPDDDFNRDFALIKPNRVTKSSLAITLAKPQLRMQQLQHVTE
jgi:hypothetical protein